VAGVTVLVLAGEVNAEEFDVAEVLEVATENLERGGEKLRRPLASPPSLDSRDTTADKSSDPPPLAWYPSCCCCPKIWFFFEKKDRMPGRKVLFFLPPGVVSSDCGVGRVGGDAPPGPVVEREGGAV
jgi:hypothetical protein